MAVNDEMIVSLATLKSGAAVLLFDECMNKVLANIMDPNTDAGVVREVTIKVQIKPDMNRASASMKIIPTMKLAPVVALTSRMFIGKKGGQFMAFEHDPQDLEQPMDRSDVKVHAGGRQ